MENEMSEKDFKKMMADHKAKFIKENTLKSMVYENEATMSFLFKEVAKLSEEIKYVINLLNENSEKELTEEELPLMSEKDFKKMMADHKAKFIKENTLKSMVYENGALMSFLFKEVAKLSEEINVINLLNENSEKELTEKELPF